jgi:hypothetical protein
MSCCALAGFRFLLPEAAWTAAEPSLWVLLLL